MERPQRAKVLAWMLASTLPVLLVFTIATFPREWLDESLPSLRVLPMGWPPWGSDTASLHDLLVAGKVDYVTGRPKSLWSNRLVLENFEVGDRVKFDAEDKIAISSDTVSLRGRSLEGADLAYAHLRKADFTKAQLQGAWLWGAQLQGAELSGAQLKGATLESAQLQGAALRGAQLQGANLEGAQLQGADLEGAKLQGASMVDAQLQAANLEQAELPGAYLRDADLQGINLARALLQGADLEGTQLQGADLEYAELRAANLDYAFVWRSGAPQKAEDVWGTPIRYAKARRPACAICTWDAGLFRGAESVNRKQCSSGA